MDLRKLFISFATDFTKKVKGEDAEFTQEDLETLIEALGGQEGIEESLTQYAEDPEGFLESFIESMQEGPTEEEEVEFAKKGTKIKALLQFKKGGKSKCACGCSLVKSKSAGGKIVSKCACGCKTTKTGGKIDGIDKAVGLTEFKRYQDSVRNAQFAEDIRAEKIRRETEQNKKTVSSKNAVKPTYNAKQDTFKKYKK